MKRVMAVEAVAGEGLAGDRYAEGTGYYSGVDEREVTLIEGETIDAIDAETELAIVNGEHHGNIVTGGVKLLDLRGTRSRQRRSTIRRSTPIINGFGRE